MHAVLKLLGRNVQRLRLARDMTMERLAGKADLSVYVLGRIETGKSNPGIDAVFRLARALGVQPADLLMNTPPRGSRRRN
jgi:XRE family transcriptional regulator, regulator of sulfur utilization